MNNNQQEILNDEEILVNDTETLIEEAAQNEAKKQKQAGRGGRIASYIILSIVAAIVILPFLFAIAGSFATQQMATDVSFRWYHIFNPAYWMKDGYTIDMGWKELSLGNFSFDNYIYVLSMTFQSGLLEGQNKILFGLINTLIDSVPMVVLGVICSTMAAYAVARVDFKGRNAVFFTLLASMMIPAVLTMIPAYIMFTNIYHWNETPLPLIIPGACGGAITVFFIKQFYMTFPKELEEAALIDGLGRWGIFWKVAFPLAKPVIMTQIILSLNGAYNDYLNPLIYVGTVEHFKTLQLHLAELTTDQNPNTVRPLAGAIISLIPTFILYMLAQKVFVDGIVMTGIKG